MTVEMVEIFLQILILLAFGFLFSKRDIITDSMKNGLSTLLLKAVLPLVILSSSQVAFDGSVLQGFVGTMAVSLVFYVVVVGGLGLVRKRIPIPDGGNRIFVLLCAYGNDGFIGIPLAMQFFGSAGMLYCISLSRTPLKRITKRLLLIAMSMIVTKCILVGSHALLALPLLIKMQSGLYLPKHMDFR